MREIVVIGDTHAELQRLTRVLGMLADGRPDLVLLTGDVGLDPPWSPAARQAERAAHDGSVRRVIGQVARELACPVVFVPGNHDLPHPVDDSGGTNCDGRWVEPAGLRVAGLGGAGPQRFGFPYEWSEQEADAALSELFGGTNERPDIFLSHTPPADTPLDRTRRGAHVGSSAVHAWIGAARPRLFVCGHIHEAWGVERIDGVPCLNAGALGDPYAEEIVWRVSWDAGAPRRIRSLRRRAWRKIETRDWL